MEGFFKPPHYTWASSCKLSLYPIKRGVLSIHSIAGNSYMWADRKNKEGLIMKRKILSVFWAVVLLPFLLSGCKGNAEDEQVIQDNTQLPQNITQSSRAETEASPSVPVYQFVEKHGIVKSEIPIYIMEADTAPALTKGEVTITLIDVVQQDKRLIANFTVLDRTETEREDDSVSPFFEIRMTGPGIEGKGLRPEDSQRTSDPDFYKEYGYVRSFFTAFFELPFTEDNGTSISGYAFHFSNMEQPFEFSMRQVPRYETLNALAAGEGGMDTHDGFSVLAVAEEVDEGILVYWYRFSEDIERIAGISYTPPTPMREGTWPVLSSGDKEYEFKRSSRYIDTVGFFYQLTDRFSGVGKQLFIVPQGERKGVFSLTIPGITYLSHEESPSITLQIPEDMKELAEEIPFREGSVRIHRITKMKEPQIKEITDRQGQTIEIERPAVYIDVSAVSGTKELSLRRLICRSKSGTEYGPWENQRYDFDENGNLCGFRIFYNEGDTEISLKFSLPGFYFNLPYKIKLQPKG